MADIESMSEDADDETYLHNKKLDAESQEVEGNNLVVNALSILRAPRKSELACKRKLKVNQQKQHTRNVQAKTSTAPKVSALARIREFPDEHFKEFFCLICDQTMHAPAATARRREKQQVSSERLV